MTRHPLMIWCSRIVAILVVAGLSAYLAVVGLDKADKIASVLSLLVALLALGAPYLLPAPQTPDATSAPEPATAPGQSVTNAVVGGRLTQAKNVGDLHLSAAAAGSPPPSQAATPPADETPEDRHGQYVSGVWVAGNLTQVDGADGDVTIE